MERDENLSYHEWFMAVFNCPDVVTVVELENLLESDVSGYVNDAASVADLEDYEDHIQEAIWELLDAVSEVRPDTSRRGRGRWWK